MEVCHRHECLAVILEWRKTIGVGSEQIDEAMLGDLVDGQRLRVPECEQEARHRVERVADDAAVEDLVLHQKHAGAEQNRRRGVPRKPRCIPHVVAARIRQQLREVRCVVVEHAHLLRRGVDEGNTNVGTGHRRGGQPDANADPASRRQALEREVEAGRRSAPDDVPAEHYVIAHARLTREAAWAVACRCSDSRNKKHQRSKLKCSLKVHYSTFGEF